MDQMEDVEIECPYCGETFGILVDTSFASLEMIEDCSVCCHPIQLNLRFSGGEIVSVEAKPS
ncbi:MAG: CPXCG motif-containing cysteine-rich protein [Verrucomicrobia bacterium]|nr:CPXCG motif-containing cysteine-rich protein [Verrucomicrobiota bacterium]